MTRFPKIQVAYPDWVERTVDWDRRHASVEERMRVAIALARENVLRETGGPFGAAVFERDTGTVVAVGMNLVVSHHNSMLHAEMVALMMAEGKRRSYSLGAEGLPSHEMVTSCDPCAMCLGGMLWSGVTRLVCGATREDARRLEFEEGPVFEKSYEYLEARGIAVVRRVLRDEAREVLELYRDRGGIIYNG